MAPNTTWTLRLTVKVTAPSGSVITETGSATEVTPDPNPADATSTVSMAVECRARQRATSSLGSAAEAGPVFLSVRIANNIWGVMRVTA